MNYFNVLGLNDALLKTVEDLGFESPSEIQEKVIPVLLGEKTDLIGLAQTGTGKTAAFGFPMIQRTEAGKRSTQGLILSPTRELCLQITADLQSYSAYIPGMNIVAIYGGASITEQAKAVKKGAQIIVATPGRMQDMIRRKLVDISEIEYCVLDEADEMLNMGFYEAITDILRHTPEAKSTWLFSATMPKTVAAIAREFMKHPVEITVGSRNSGAATVQHEYYMVQGRDRYAALKYLVDANPDIFSVVFCRTKRDTQQVAEKLIEDGYNAAALHGDLSQQQRDMVMKAFRTGQVQLLVATDVAARGIDVEDITHVIHYQLPDDPEVYTHRSGRTGRAGKSGISMIIVTKSETRKIKALEKNLGQRFEWKKIPNAEEICEIQLYHLASKIKNTTVHKDIHYYLPAVNDVLKELDRDALIKKMFSVAFSRFASYYKNARDLNVSGKEPQDSSREEQVRYFINLGERDGYDWKTLKDLIRNIMQLDRDEVFKVEVKDSFSFFTTQAVHSEAILQMFTDFKMNGRFINVEVASHPGGRKKKKRGGKEYKMQYMKKSKKAASKGKKKKKKRTHKN